jgi:type 1 glutamine amidotransferase
VNLKIGRYGSSFHLAAASLALSAAMALPVKAAKLQKVLVYDKAGWYVHPEIPQINDMFRKMAADNGFQVDVSSNPADFNAAKLTGYQVVVLNNISEMGTSIKDNAQRTAFQQYLENGGGAVGLHGTGVVRGTWQWFIDKQGSDWCYDAAMQEGRVFVPEKAKSHPINRDAPTEARLTDEWNNFHVNVDTVPGITVVLSIDESSYDPTKKKLAPECNNRAGFRMSDPQSRWGHPVSWVRNVGQGRLFYSMIGHHMQSMGAPFSKTHFLNAIKWAAGDLEDVTSLPGSGRPGQGRGATLKGSRIECAAGGSYRVEVFSFQGRRVLDMAGIGPLRFDLHSALPPGAYRVRIAFGAGKAAGVENVFLF